MKANRDHTHEWWHGEIFKTCRACADMGWINFYGVIEEMGGDWQLVKLGKVIGDEE